MSCLGCIAIFFGCAFVTVLAAAIGIFLFRDQMLGLTLQFAGFESQGNTATYLQQSAPVIPTVPPLTNATSPETFSITGIETNESFTVQNNRGVQVTTGTAAEGDAATVTTTEEELVALCMDGSNICSPTGEDFNGLHVSNARVDLLSGSAVIRADVDADQLPIPQNIGLAVQVSPTGDALIVRGVDINGRLYANPPPEFEDVILEAERALQEGLNQISLGVEGRDYQLSQIVIEENSLTVLLR